MSELNEILLRLKIGLIILATVFLFGTFSFYILEPGAQTLLDAFYYTLVTISTVGYGDITPVTQQGKLVTILIIFFGVGSVFITIPTFFELIVKKEIREVLKLPTEKSNLNNHTIICGWGKVGKAIVDRLIQDKAPFIVIDDDPERIKHLVEMNCEIIEGSATSETILNKANIKTAKTMVTTLEDNSNILVALTAKILNPEIRIISKVDYTRNEAKLRKAGADEIINVHEIGALQMLNLI